MRFTGFSGVGRDIGSGNGGRIGLISPQVADPLIPGVSAEG